MDPRKTALCLILEDEFGPTTIVPLHKKHFNDSIGTKFIQDYAVAGDTDVTLLYKNQIEQTDGSLFEKNCVNFKYLKLDGFLSIDTKTARQLELVACSIAQKNALSLFSVLNSTLTPMGARQLKANLLQPLNDLGQITERLEAVQELLDDEPKLHHIRTSLKGCLDMDWIISSLIRTPKKHSVKVSENSLNNIISLKQQIKNAIAIKDSLVGVKCTLLKRVEQRLSHPSIENIKNQIDAQINEDVTFQKSAVGLRNQRCYAVKAGWNGLLDVARQTYRESTNDVYELARTYLMSDKTITELLRSICEDVMALYKSSEAVGLLDLVSNFATVAKNAGYTRPEFTETIAVKGARHPIKEKSSTDPFIPNDIYCSKDTNLQIISGPNMSGKSTYIRMIALVSIMGQMGSFVPAEYASLRLNSNVFSRIGFDSSTDSTASSFMKEMKEAAYILQNASSNSLIILDELGRGTSLSDGIGMTVAICEELSKSSASIFMATHFDIAGYVLSNYPNTVLLRLDVAYVKAAGDSVDIRYRYEIKDGLTEGEHYGFFAANMTNFPSNIVARASEMSKEVTRQLHHTHKTQAGSRKAAKDTLNKLIQAVKTSNLEEKQLLKYLHTIQLGMVEAE
ncbi:MutS protein msh4 [Chytridiales sp. JEL 0842]|nr:MutS protein msh4 [Chytridiales sp. JEL 0842]